MFGPEGRIAAPHILLRCVFIEKPCQFCSFRIDDSLNRLIFDGNHNPCFGGQVRKKKSLPHGMYIEAFWAMDVSLIIFRMVLAIVIGGIIGAEREYQNKSAGFRTMMLICMGSALFTIVSMELDDTHTPDRIASNIVTGIGFVGAGVIFKGDTGINGITTAATIWVVAALGMGIGGGFEWISIAGCLL